MPEHLGSPEDVPTEAHSHQDALRLLSRSPHPYHRQSAELPESSEKFYLDPTRSRTAYPATSRDATPSSDSGTEADDEHFLKGLPAPRRQHKGLRGRNEVDSGASTPLLTPPADEYERRLTQPLSPGRKKPHHAQDARTPTDTSRRSKEIVRRLTELVLLAGLGAVVARSDNVRPTVQNMSREFKVWGCIILGVALLYPARLCLWAYQHRSPPSRKIPVTIPSSFDPAPFLYPPAIGIFVAALIAVGNEAVMLPNLIITLCSLPLSLFPEPFADSTGNSLQWLLSCAPLFVSRSEAWDLKDSNGSSEGMAVTPEMAVLLYPLHQNLCQTLHTLTTTSLLPAELQLLSIALLNVLVLSSSPQMIILKAILWTGGLDLLVSCSHVVSWGISLARVPKWRFKRILSPSRDKATGLSKVFANIVPWKRVRHDLFHAPMDSSSCSSCEAFDDPDESDGPKIRSAKGHPRVNTMNFETGESSGVKTFHLPSELSQVAQPSASDSNVGSPPQRRHTLSSFGQPLRKSHTHTPSGRKKRSASSSVRQFFTLTQQQATVRKWMYAAYVYACIIAALFVPLRPIGAMKLVMDEGLGGQEPIGWALGYMFGELKWFRWQVISNNLERWICLPPRRYGEKLVDPDIAGWAEAIRVDYVGAATTRLALCGYCGVVIAVGLIVVFRLSPFYEVDTRRKVFHFMMVAMFLPLTYVDPAFVAMALAIILGAFLLLDLLRASQLPPLSKPLATFLAPYVDGRDLRGPVVISHIFLLIGCAIPLWLSLGSLTRTGTGYLEGWEVPTREVSMVAGVVCVGLGDAAASLIGRRYGHRKWLWGGGKSIEGSVAFAVAVFAGLLAASAWLRLGGWPTTTGTVDPWYVSAQKTGACSTLASMTEAVLTGGNDNVVVPVVLWTCVKSLGV